MGVYKDPRKEVELPWRKFDPRRYRPGIDLPTWAAIIMDERALNEEEHARLMKELPPVQIKFNPKLKG